jgi:tRNA-dihydrouridine synthase B
MQTRMSALGVDFPFLVAPMVGLSHVAFRELIRLYTPRNLKPLVFTEMLSSRLLPQERLDRAEQLKVAWGGEKPFVPQILGNEERFIAPSIDKLMGLEPWGIDINMGCPVTHSLRHNWGVLLMGDRRYAADVVGVTKRHSPVPVSVKMRSSPGEGEDVSYLLDFTAALEDAGADWLTIHARPRGKKHHGEANWSTVGEVRRARKIPVVANGDIQTADDAIQVVRDFGADGAMIARAAVARPWILWQIAHRMGIEESPWGRGGEKPPETPEEEGREFFRACLLLADLLDQYYGQGEPALKRLRFFVGIGSQWLPFGHSFWKKCMKGTTLAEVRSAIASHAESYPQKLASRVSFS